MSYGIFMTKVRSFLIAWRYIKRCRCKLLVDTHNIIVHNLNYKFDVCLDIRMVQFVNNALKLFNEDMRTGAGRLRVPRKERNNNTI